MKAPQAAPQQALACFGAVMHERFGAVHNRFVYPLAFLRIPLSRLDGLRVPLLGINRPGLFSLRNEDHGARDGSALLPWLRGLLQRRGLAEACDGEVVLQTFPRLLGYVFNPVSFWFCHDRGGALRAVLAEVNNTFGEHHHYLLHHPDLSPIAAGQVFEADKAFHVSPFYPVRGHYRFTFECDGPVWAVRIDYWDREHKLLATRIAGRGQALDGRAMARWALRFPLMTFGVIARIHWQALRLWWRGVPFHRKPLPPVEESRS